MVYKKYIKKNGKIYGPYAYQSKRVDGKVVSEYIGPKHHGKSANKLYILLIVAALVAVLLVYLFFTLKSNNFSGNIVSNIADSFKESGVSDKTSVDPGSLANQEKVDLGKSFGDGIVQQTARNYKDWIIITFKVGNYEIEYSYNNNLSKEELNSLIEKDKANWLNQISGK